MSQQTKDSFSEQVCVTTGTFQKGAAIVSLIYSSTVKFTNPTLYIYVNDLKGTEGRKKSPKNRLTAIFSRFFALYRKINLAGSMSRSKTSLNMAK